MDARASASQSEAPDHLATPRRSCGPLASPTCHPSSLSQSALRRQASAVRAVCVNALVRIRAGGVRQLTSLPRPPKCVQLDPRHHWRFKKADHHPEAGSNAGGRPCLAAIPDWLPVIMKDILQPHKELHGRNRGGNRAEENGSAWGILWRAGSRGGFYGESASETREGHKRRGGSNAARADLARHKGYCGRSSTGGHDSHRIHGRASG